MRASWFLLLVLSASLAGCGDDETKAGEEPALDIDADADRSGEIEGTDAEDGKEDSWPGAIVAVNVDDDDEDGVVDGDEPGESEGEDDLGRVVVRAGGGELSLLLEGDADRFRVYLGGKVVLGATDGGTESEYSVAEDARRKPELELEIEGLEFNSTVTLRAELRSQDGEVLESDEVVVSTPPFVMMSNLDRAQRIYVAGSAGLLDNTPLRMALVEILGRDRVIEIDIHGRYGDDLWFQDEFQVAYQRTPGGFMHLVLDSITDWGLDPFPEDELLGPGFGWLERGERPPTIQTDSFGNLECTPPLNAGGIEYPFGRIYYGGKPGAKQMAEGLRRFLEEQEIQAPLELDVSWLIVGHVDEFVGFIPDPDAEKGFKVLVSDYAAALEVIEALDPATALPRFQEFGFGTVGEFLASEFPAYNARVQEEHVDPVVETIRNEFGLDEEDLVRVPSLWAEIAGTALALMPNMVNLQVYDEHLLIADPFFRTPDEDIDGDRVLQLYEDINGNGVLDTDEDLDRDGELDEGEDLNGNGALDTEEDLDGDGELDEGEDLNGDGRLNTFADPMIACMRQRLPAGVQAHFLDNWSTHAQGGEVHCATQVVRTPPESPSWWDVVAPPGD